jgi:hypothetical protein
MLSMFRMTWPSRSYLTGKGAYLILHEFSRDQNLHLERSSLFRIQDSGTDDDDAAMDEEGSPQQIWEDGEE